MFDAAAAATAAEVNQEQVAQQQAESALSGEGGGEPTAPEQESQDLLQAIASYNPGESTTEVVFVDAGQLALNPLATLTGADVAASTEDQTGHVSQLGDWRLEASTGTIEAAVAVDASTQATWEGTLASDEGPVLGGIGELQPQNEVRHELVILDPGVQNSTALRDLLAAQQEAGRDLEVVVLDANRDGVEQIREILSRYQDLDALHLLSHGTADGLQLGSTWLDAQTMSGYADVIRGWEGAFSTNGDLLLYGCDLAASDAGRSLVDTLGQWTGTDVAASTDLTGYALFGGDWELEYRTGSIETEDAPNLDTQHDWAGLMSVAIDSTSTGTTTGTSATISHTTSGSNRLMLVGISFGRAGSDTVGSVTYNGDSLTFVGAQQDSDGRSRIEIWSLLAPDLGTYDVIVNFPSGSGSEGATVGVTTFTDVDQSTPLGTFASAQSTGSATASATVSSAAGELVFGVVAVRQGTNFDLAPGAGQAELWDLFTSSANGGASTEAGAASVVTSWTWGGTSTRWSAGGVSIKPIGGETTLTQRVAAASDDAEEEGPTGTTPNRMWLNSSDIELISDREAPATGEQKVGLRFTGMNIPIGATITSAHLVFRAVAADPGATNSEATNLTLKGQLIGDASTFTTTSGDISSRALTSASTAWTPTTWTSGLDYNSPDISSVVQEIVNQGTWASGNDLAIIITGTGHRASQAYDTDPLNAAQLVVTYTMNEAPTITSLSGDSLSYSEGAGAVVIEQGGNALVADVDSTDFNTGTLTVSIPSGGDSAEDALSIRNQGTGAGQIGVSGSNVTYQGVTIGTFTGGSGGSNLVITLNASATPTAVTALVKNITYENTDTAAPTTGARTVRYVLTDGDGGTSANYDTTVTVNAVNDAPTDLSLSANTVAENAANGTVVGTVSGTDPDSGDTKTYSLTDTAAGRFAINSATGQITVANGSLLNYESAPSHSVTVRVTDSGGLTYDETFAINLTNVNEAPTGADATVTINEDTSHTLTTANFGFSDVDAGDTMSAVRIDTLSGAGPLTLSGVAVTAGQVVTVADITAGNLVFTPAADANGTGYTSVTFSVRDSSSTYDTAPNTLTFDLTAVNDAPIRTAGTVSNLTVSEDVGLVSLGLGSVTYSPGGGADENGQTLTYAVSVIPSISAGDVFLADGTTRVTVGSYTLAEIQGMQFKPAANASAVTAFQFNVSDSGGTANGGVNTLSQFILITVNAVNDAPTITNLSGDSLAYSEGDGAVVIEQGANALVADVDSTNLDTGTLIVSIPSGGDSAEDVLSIRNQGTGAGQIGVSGSNVTYEGVTIGTFTGGSGGTSLVITLNASATPTAVTALVKNVTYENTDTGAPTTGARTVRYVLTDGDGGTSANYDTTVTVSAVNDGPTISMPGGVQTFTEGGSPVLFDPTASVTDLDSTDFDGGTLTASIPSNASVDDRIGIRNQGVNPGQIGVSGTGVTYGGVIIGTFTGGTSGSTPLVVTFNTNATLAAVNALATNVTFSNVSDTPSTATRLIRMVVTDGDGGTSNNGQNNLNVVATNDAPTITNLGGDSLSYSEGAGAVVIEQGGSALVADVDSTNLDTGTLTVSIPSGGDSAEDVLSIRNQGTGAGQIGVSGSNLTYEGVTIGTFTGGSGGSNLVIMLNASATPTAVTALVQNITYENTDTAAPTTGARTVRYVLTDGDGGTSANYDTTVTVSGVNDAPVNTVPGAQSVTEDTALALSGISVNDVDGNLSTVQVAVGNGTLTVTLSGGATISSGSNGTNTLTLSGNQADINATLATLIYQGTLNYNGSDTLTVTSTDANSGSDVDTVAITVTAVNDPTSITGGTSGSGNEDTTLTGTLTATDSDGLSDGTVFSVSANATNGTASIDPATGLWSYSPNADWNGSDSFTVTITDDAGNSSTQVISVTVTPVVDLTNDSLTTNEDTAISANVLTGTNGATADSFEGTPVLTSVTQGANGSVTFLANGTVTYTPNANFNGTDSFTYTITSGGVTETATVTVTDPTSITGGTSGSGNEDTTLTGTLTATDSDGLSDGTVFSVSANATNGTASIDPATGLWSYSPNADWNGSDSFTVTITDDAGNSSTQVISVTVTPVVDLTNDSLTTNEDTAISANVLTGTNGATADSFEGTPVLTSVTQGANGSVTFLANGTVTYTPNANYNGPDSFTYTITSGGVTETATVTVTVTAVNDPTNITGGTSGSGTEDTTVTGTLTATDNDGLSDGTVFSVSANATNGTASIDPATGLWSYSPNADWNGSDSFTVTITDDAGNSSTQVISVTVTPVVDITNDSLTTNEDTAISANVLTGTNGATADSFEGTPILTSVTQGANGSVTFLADGTVTYTPNANFNGTDSFTYTITSGGVTETATVTVTVTAVNDPTSITGGTSGSGNEDTTLTGTLTATDSDGLSDGTVFSVSANATNGTASIDPATGLWSYTPTADWNGADSFTVTITDDAGNTSTQVISVTVTPVVDLTNDSLTTNEDTAISANVLTGTNGATADNFEGTPVLTSVTQGANGSVTFLADGTVTYTPNANFNGPDTFTYTITSGGVTETATVNVTVTAVNDPTVVTGGTSGTGNEDTTVTGTLTATDSDGLSDGSVFSVSANATNGTASIDPATGLWSYTPNSDYNGSDSFTVTITDDAGNSSTQVISVTVTAQNDGPTLMTNTGSTVAEGGTDTLDSSELAVTDVDNTAAQLLYTIGTGPAYGRLELTTAPGVSATTFTQADIAANQLVYVHDGSETTSDSFTFTVSDGAGGTVSTTTLTLTITPVNDTPTITSGGAGPTATINVLENVSAVTIVTAADVDLPAQALTYTISGGADQARFTINTATGALNFTAPPDFEAATDANGDNVYVVQVQVMDSQGASTTQMIQVTVTDVAESVPPPPDPIVPPVLLAPPPPSPTGPGPGPVPPSGPAEPPTELLPQAPVLPESRTVPVQAPPATVLSSPTERLVVIRPEEPRATSDEAKESVLFPWIDEARRLLVTGLLGEPPSTPDAEPDEKSQSVSELLFSKLDEMTASLEQAMGVSQEQHTVTMRVAALTGTTLSAGFIAWALRSGTLLASFMATMPAWRHFDPLPVLGGTRSEWERRKKEAEQDQQTENTEFKGLKHLLDLGLPPDPKP